MRTFQRGAAVVLGLSMGAASAVSTGPTEDDPMVRAFVQAYAPLIDSVEYGDDDVVFTLGDRRIHFQEGRMLDEKGLERAGECDPIFYSYPLEPLTDPPRASEVMPTYCTDVLEGFFGRTEEQIREHGRSIVFLDHRMFVNELLVEPVAAAERDIVRAARSDASVAEWVEQLDVTYSFSSREIAGSGTRSQHAWGMAFDLVPTSYEGRHVYWRWSRVFDRDGWDRIPVEQRWSPPQQVIDIFEAHGFIWGGKWAHFDAIHFEYRPEILLYSRFVEQEAGMRKRTGSPPKRAPGARLF